MSDFKKLFYVFDDESTEVNIDKLFVYFYNQLPNTYVVNFTIDLKSFLDELTKEFSLTKENFITKYEEACRDNLASINYDRAVYLIKPFDKLLLLVSSEKAEFYYASSVNSEKLEQILEIFKSNSKKGEVSRKFYMVKKHGEDFALKAFDIRDVEIDLELFFNDDFLPVHQRIVDFINDQESSGVVLLYGKPGTGKTFYLKYLISHIDKRFILLPKNKFAFLESLNFYFFISDYKDSVLILEDATGLLSSTGKTTFLAEFLKNAQGLFANPQFNYKIICTAPIQEHVINLKNLQRADKIIRYEFKELSVEKANKLREKLNIPGYVDKPSVLFDVIKNNDIEITTRKLGFKL